MANYAKSDVAGLTESEFAFTESGRPRFWIQAFVIGGWPKATHITKLCSTFGVIVGSNDTSSPEGKA